MPATSLLLLLACGGTPRPASGAGSETVAATDPDSDDPETSSDTRDDDPVSDGPGEELSVRTESPLDPKPLDGPYARLEDYFEASPAPHDDQCGARPQPSTRPHRVAAAGRFKEGQLLRAPGSIACAPIEYCVLALRTAEGWFVRPTSEPCQGVVGPGSAVSTLAPKTRWVGTANDQVLALELTRHTKTVEVSERGGHRDEREQQRESRYVTLCGLGASGKPSCTTPVVLSCPDAQGKTNEAKWSWSGGEVTFESEANPQDACEWDTPFVVGTFALRFP